MYGQRKDPRLELLERVFEDTLNDKLMWHREDYYQQRFRYDETIGRIGSLKDEIEAAQIGVNRVGANKNKRYLSERNLEKIQSFRAEIRTLRKERARLRKISIKSKRSLNKAAKKRVKRVRKFCVTIGGDMVVVYEKRRSVYAEVHRGHRDHFGGKRYGSQIHFGKRVYSDEQFPQLITLMILLRSGDYLVDSEIEQPMQGWAVNSLA